MKTSVTPEHVRKFAHYVAAWCEMLSLGDWRIQVSEKVAQRKVMAEVFKTDLEQRLAAIRLCKDWGESGPTDKALNETALHEVLHVFLHELIETAKRNPDVDTLRSVEHRVINVLERLLSEK